MLFKLFQFQISGGNPNIISEKCPNKNSDRFIQKGSNCIYEYLYNRAFPTFPMPKQETNVVQWAKVKENPILKESFLKNSFAIKKEEVVKQKWITHIAIKIKNFPPLKWGRNGAGPKSQDPSGHSVVNCATSKDSDFLLSFSNFTTLVARTLSLSYI